MGKRYGMRLPTIYQTTILRIGAESFFTNANAEKQDTWGGGCDSSGLLTDSAS